MKDGRSNNRGFTLLELLVGSSMGIVVTLAAFAFAQRQTRNMAYVTESVTLSQAGRSVIDMLAEDLRHAGAGVGYRADGTFGGIYTGSFRLGGATFNAS